jgi:hypothetical protein
MNDLTEKALHAINVAQAEVRGRAALSLAAAGFVAASVVVVAGGRAAGAPATGALTNWFGLVPFSGGRQTAEGAGAILLAGLVALSLLWAAASVAVRTAALTERAVWAIAFAWALPFVIGPPVMDTRVYADVGRGLLQRAGRDPYHVPLSALGHAPILGVIDPALHDLTSAAGPLTTLIQHLAVAASGGHATGAVVMLRLVGFASFLALGRGAADLAGARRSRALVLALLNPLVLLYVVSGAHLDGLAAALVVAALVSADQRRWARAILLCSLAASVQPVMFVAVAVIVVVHALGRRGGPVWLVAGRDLGEAAVITLAIGFGVKDGFGWIRNVQHEFFEYVPWAPANFAGKLIGPVVRSASFDDLAAGGRLTALIAAAAIIVYLLVSARYRPVDHTAGYALLAVALLAPDVYPWFVLWGVACLVPTVTGMRRTVVMLLCVVAVLVMPPGFTDQATDRIGYTAVAAGFLALAVASWRTRAATGPPAVYRPPEISRTAGRTSAR